MRYTNALPIPNSAKLRMVRIFENNPLIPKYSAPNELVKMVRHIKLTIR